ncbi:SET domain-containing histone-lysine N-methyltransferase [Vitiosangium sp. GDMCC 1.1324]|uniref:SET domain-containing histone-lysine N-methyltransferase n=1 Tax=Vitiosangium sp. (strain GDMCC 1.1324) TaxID=2138576 RepID=UPI00130EBFBA|nr:SET domain-containing histone-lysine N-methyltransferase [Vitiosangium sp. GDMCC 1.1324]
MTETQRGSHGDEQGLEALYGWLERAGAHHPKLRVIRLPGGERGVFTLADVAQGEVVLRVPRECLLTTGLARSSEIGRLLESHLEAESDELYLAAFLLQEKQREGSFWRPYLETLPASVPHSLLFLEERELQLLQGSAVLEELEARREMLHTQHALLRAHIPGWASLTATEFLWACVVVSSRNFGVKLRGNPVRCLAPLADMLNHKTSPDVHWGLSEDEESFEMVALKALPAGQEIHDSYGAKSNHRFLLHYGFVLEDNEHDELVVHLGIPEGDPWSATKQRLLELSSPSERRRFQSRLPYGHESTQEMFSFLRIACAEAEELSRLSVTPGASGGQVEPLSIANEERVLAALGAACEARLSGFDTSLEEDERLLAEEPSSRSVRNCILMRREEKRLLHAYAERVRTGARLLRKPWPELEQLAAGGGTGGGPLDDYAREGVLKAVRNDPWNRLERAARQGHHFGSVALGPRSKSKGPGR